MKDDIGMNVLHGVVETKSDQRNGVHIVENLNMRGTMASEEKSTQI